MHKSKWLSEVAQALHRQGLSTAYIRRFTAELADHCEDLCQEATSMDANQVTARLGSPDELASHAAQELRLRTYAGRHPLITFVAAPLPTAMLLLIGVCLSFVLVLSAIPEASAADDPIPVWAEIGMQGVVWAMRYVPFIAGAILFCQIAKRAFCAPRWSFVACVMVALLAGLFAVNLTLPTNGPGSGSLVMGFVVPPGPAQFLQAMSPFAIWCVYAVCESRRRSTTDPA
jgi:hypothetical protein